jgi:hypothetical protein
VRGASALQTLLTRHPAAATKVFIVWEPILATDFGRPATWVLGRAPDLRVQQYWDAEHVVAKQMAADARPPQPTPDCCDRGGILWDMAAVYPKGVLWTDRLPVATVFTGPVVEIEDAIEKAMIGADAIAAPDAGRQ